MDVLWDCPGWLTVQEVRDALNRAASRRLAYSTVKTVLCHLNEKRFAKKRIPGRAHVYKARLTRVQAERAAVEGFLAPLASRSHAVVAHLLQTIDVSDDDLTYLEELLRGIRDGR